MKDTTLAGILIVTMFVSLLIWIGRLADKRSEPQSVCVEIRGEDGQMWNLDVPPGSPMVTISLPGHTTGSLNILSYQGRCLNDQEEGTNGSSKD